MFPFYELERCSRNVERAHVPVPRLLRTSTSGAPSITATTTTNTGLRSGDGRGREAHGMGRGRAVPDGARISSEGSARPGRGSSKALRQERRKQKG